MGIIMTILYYTFSVDINSISHKYYVIYYYLILIMKLVKIINNVIHVKEI